MIQEPEATTYQPDPAAVFASALSLWQACHKRAASKERINLSECYNGMDQFMREVMRVASQFETWACSYVVFEELQDVWSYLLEDSFGKALLNSLPVSDLARFDETDCLRVALHLRLPIKPNEKLPIPIDTLAGNPVPGSAFRQYRIQTVRDQVHGDQTVPFTADDDPFDPEFDPPYFGLYGVDEEGLLEHIADRRTYAEAVSLAQKLAPGAVFPGLPATAYPQAEQ